MTITDNTCNPFEIMLTCNTNWRCLHVSILYYRIFRPTVPGCWSVPARYPTALCTDRPDPIPRMVLCPLHHCQWHLVCHAGVGGGVLGGENCREGTGAILTSPLVLTFCHKCRFDVIVLFRIFVYIHIPECSLS